MAGQHEIAQRMSRQVARCNGCDQRLGHRMPDSPAGIDRIERVEPPLQADFAELRFAHHLAQPGNFDIEGIERQQMRPLLGGREEEARKRSLSPARTKSSQ